MHAVRAIDMPTETGCPESTNLLKYRKLRQQEEGVRGSPEQFTLAGVVHFLHFCARIDPSKLMMTTFKDHGWTF
jgi:hypothetical protein